MTRKNLKRIGWILSVIVALLLAMSALMKLSQNETAITQATAIGINSSTYFLIGIVEIVSLSLFLIPRTGVLGGLLLIAYMGGAIATHIQNQQPIFMVIAIQVALWIALVLRHPELLQRLMPATQKTN